jgi:hypothetical protein
MLSYNEYITEQTSRKVLDTMMANHGYGRPAVGADGHITYTNKEDSNDQMLIDVPGGEWHSMTKGKVSQKGSLKDGSLEKYLT